MSNPCLSSLHSGKGYGAHVFSCCMVYLPDSHILFFYFKNTSLPGQRYPRLRCVVAANYWPRGYNTFFVLNSTEHEISTAHKLKYRQITKFLALNISDVVFIMLINVKMSTFFGILTIFMSRINFVLI